MDNLQFKPLGDAGVLVVFGDEISPEINAKVRQFKSLVEEAKLVGVVEVIPAYADVLVQFNPLLIDFRNLVLKLKSLLENEKESAFYPPKTMIIPVCYEGDFAPDLEEVCKYIHISKAELIAIHTSPAYLIYMMGFTPGFCYLGGMDKRIATPRKATPRLKIAAGAVGIAGEQTGIYPIESPGGWQIIGQTPLKMFDPTLKNPFPVQQGDCIRFKAVNSVELQRIQRQIIERKYLPEYE